MATSYKTAQAPALAGGVGNYDLLYAADGCEAIISTIVICNTTGSAASYRVAVNDGVGEPTLAKGSFLVYDGVVAGNDSIFLTLGVGIQDGYKLVVSASAETVLFNAFVSEVS